MKKSAKKPRAPGLPSREDLLAFIGTHKGKAGVREIAHENDSVAQDLTVTVGVLASRADEFEREVRRPARAA